MPSETPGSYLQNLYQMTTMELVTDRQKASCRDAHSLNHGLNHPFVHRNRMNTTLDGLPCQGEDWATLN